MTAEEKLKRGVESWLIAAHDEIFMNTWIKDWININQINSQ